MNNKIMIKERLKSWAVWSAVLGAVGIILNSFDVFEIIGLTAPEWDAIINAIGGALVAFGILNNPTDKNHF